jgi:uncharacterized protein (TIGR02452 family)
VVAKELHDRGLRPLVLNMANATEPGGGYRHGDGAQEENLFRRSNYHVGLDPELTGTNKHYPIGLEFEQLPRGGKSAPWTGAPDLRTAVYTSSITVFRDTEDEGYRLLDTPYQVDCVAVAAFRWKWHGAPVWNPEQTTDRAAITRMKAKIDLVLAVAIERGHDAVVLSAIGCGAFRNPVVQVAEIFHAALRSYGGYFKNITFAIIDDHNSKGAGNFKLFRDYFAAHKVGSSPQPLTVLKDVCDHGGRCNAFATCDATKSHPPICPEVDTCKRTHEKLHALLFRHERACPHGGQ